MEKLEIPRRRPKYQFFCSCSASQIRIGRCASACLSPIGAVPQKSSECILFIKRDLISPAAAAVAGVTHPPSWQPQFELWQARGPGFQHMFLCAGRQAGWLAGWLAQLLLSCYSQSAHAVPHCIVHSTSPRCWTSLSDFFFFFTSHQSCVGRC